MISQGRDRQRINAEAEAAVRWHVEGQGYRCTDHACVGDDCDGLSAELCASACSHPLRAFDQVEKALTPRRCEISHGSQAQSVPGTDRAVWATFPGTEMLFLQSIVEQGGGQGRVDTA